MDPKSSPICVCVILQESSSSTVCYSELEANRRRVPGRPTSCADSLLSPPAERDTGDLSGQGAGASGTAAADAEVPPPSPFFPPPLPGRARRRGRVPDFSATASPASSKGGMVAVPVAAGPNREIIMLGLTVALIQVGVVPVLDFLFAFVAGSVKF